LGPSEDFLPLVDREAWIGLVPMTLEIDVVASLDTDVDVLIRKVIELQGHNEICFELLFSAKGTVQFV